MPCTSRLCGQLPRPRSWRGLLSSVFPASLSIGVCSCDQAEEMSLSSRGAGGGVWALVCEPSSLLFSHVLHLGAGGLLGKGPRRSVNLNQRGAALYPLGMHWASQGCPSLLRCPHPSPVASAAVWRDPQVHLILCGYSLAA